MELDISDVVYHHGHKQLTSNFIITLGVQWADFVIDHVNSKFVFRIIFYFYQMESFVCFGVSCFLYSARLCKMVWKTSLLALWTINWAKVLVAWMSSTTEFAIYHGEFSGRFFRRLLGVNGTNWFIGCLFRFYLLQLDFSEFGWPDFFDCSFQG